MADFGGGFEDNWGLQAIVRGGGGGAAAMRSDFSGGPENSCFVDDNHDVINGRFFFGFQDDNLSQSSAAILNDDLQEFYKPFYPFSDPSSSSPALQDDHHILSVKNEIKDMEKQMSLPDQSAACINDATPHIAQTPKYRRRKNQSKRVVVQVTGVDGVPSDEWAWRKYGQKPIKGSPFPRSYYRCSSSKGCLARKQVEQSCTDPGVFNISYAAEHNHNQPIRRNALAGTTRQKLFTDNKAAMSGIYKENSSNSNWPRSPNSGDVVQFAAAIEDGCSSSFKQEHIMKSDIKFEEEFFAGLEDLDGFVSELACGQQLYSSQLFNMNFYC